MNIPTTTAAALDFTSTRRHSAEERAEVSDYMLNMIRQHCYNKGLSPVQIRKALAVEVRRIEALEGSERDRFVAYLRMRKPGVLRGGREFWRNVYVFCWLKINRALVHYEPSAIPATLINPNI